MTTDETVARLLGRHTDQPLDPEILNLFSYHTVFITGAGGSIGSGIVKALSANPSCRIVAYDRSESNLSRLIGNGYPNLIPVLGDIAQDSLIEHTLQQHRPRTVIHAAAYKHLPLLERFPAQAVENNVFGTYRLLKACLKYGVSKFALVSTDKACLPTSIMGASKRLAEMITLHHCSLEPIYTFSPLQPVIVRLGNVLGSSGSVLSIFESQIAAGGPITVTSPAATRFFMSVPETANLILSTLSIAPNSGIFIPDIGRPVNIAQMAIKLAILRGHPNMKVVFTGLRPGEKMSEQLYDGDVEATSNTKIWKVNMDIGDFTRIDRDWDTLRAFIDRQDADGVVGCLWRMVPEYKTAHNIATAKG